MKKRGFVLLESIIVLVVVTLSLTMLLSTYSLVSRKTKEKEYYEKASDKYLLYSFNNYGTDKNNNYSKIVGSISNSRDVYTIKPEDCKGKAELKDKIFKVSGVTENVCESVLKELNLKKVYLVKDVNAVLEYDNNKNNLENGTIEYMKTLEKCNDEDVYVKCTGASGEKCDGNGHKLDAENHKIQKTTCSSPTRYMIGVFYRNSKYYYASIKL